MPLLSKANARRGDCPILAKDGAVMVVEILPFSAITGYWAKRAEQMVLKPDGGFMGCIAAGRAVYLDYNRKLNHAMSQAISAITGYWAKRRVSSVMYLGLVWALAASICLGKFQNSFHKL